MQWKFYEAPSYLPWKDNTFSKLSIYHSFLPLRLWFWCVWYSFIRQIASLSAQQSTLSWYGSCLEKIYTYVLVIVHTHAQKTNKKPEYDVNVFCILLFALPDRSCICTELPCLLLSWRWSVELYFCNSGFNSEFLNA